MLSVNITGLDKLRRDLEEAQRALQSLDGELTTLKFNPDDPESVQAAIRQMETAVDNKTAPYHNNALVEKVAQGMKDRLRKRILERKREDATGR